MEYRSAYGPAIPQPPPPSDPFSRERRDISDGIGASSCGDTGDGQGAQGAYGRQQRLPGPVGRLPEMEPDATSETLRQRLDVPWVGPERDGGEPAAMVREREREVDEAQEPHPFAGGAAWVSMLSAIAASDYDASKFGGGVRGALAPGVGSDGGSVPRLPVVVSQLEPCGEGFVTVLEDPTGKVRGTFHASVFASYPDLDVGSALLLQDVSMIRLERRVHIVVMPECIAVHYPRAAPGDERGAGGREESVEDVEQDGAGDYEGNLAATADYADPDHLSETCMEGAQSRERELLAPSRSARASAAVGNMQSVTRPWTPPSVLTTRLRSPRHFAEEVNEAAPVAEIGQAEGAVHSAADPTSARPAPAEIIGNQGPRRGRWSEEVIVRQAQSPNLHVSEVSEREVPREPQGCLFGSSHAQKVRQDPLHVQRRSSHWDADACRGLDDGTSTPSASHNREPLVYKRPRSNQEILPRQHVPNGGGFARDIGSAKDKYLDDCRREGVAPNLRHSEGPGANGRRPTLHGGAANNNGAGRARILEQGGDSPAYPKVAALLKMDENGQLPEDLSGEDPEMLEQILGEMMLSDPGVTWEQVKGLQFAKSSVFNAVILPSMRPDLFTGIRQPEKGLLLFGPPGTGKTLIGKAIASQAKSTFFSISASSLTSKWIGVGEKLVRSLFAVARNLQPSVIFIDEIDSMLTSRGEGENDSSRRLKTEFLCSMDGARTKSCDRVLVVGATNRPQDLDEAVLRRLAKRLYVPLPDEQARRDMIVGNLTINGGVEYQLSEDDISQVIGQTEGYSGSDMFNLVREAAMGPLMDTMQAMEAGSIGENDSLRPIVLRDFMDALSRARKSVSGEDLKALEEWNDKFGSFRR